MSSVTQHSPDVPYEITTIDGAFSDAEVDALKVFVMQRSDAASGVLHPFTASPFANGKLLNERLAAALFAKVSPHLGALQGYTDRTGVRWRLPKPSRHVFFAAMRPGEHFGIHTDTGSEFEADGEERSKFTALVYICDDALIGGETQFYTDDLVETVRVHPKRGRTLVFDIDRYHKACPVERGHKAWIGIEIVLTRSTNPV